jgi:hypothetical protein
MVYEYSKQIYLLTKISNSPRSILLAPTEKPNIPLSIDTLDEQKTDKKPKDKKKKKKKKDEERDNPSEVQDNNVEYNILLKRLC